MRAVEKPVDPLMESVAQELSHYQQHVKKLDAAHAVRKPIEVAVERCFTKTRAPEQTKAALADATGRYQQALADEALGRGDASKLKALRVELASAKQQHQDAVEEAAAAEGVLVELQKRLAEANRPIEALARDIPSKRLVVYGAVHVKLRAEYLKGIDNLLDDYALLLALNERYNQVARAGGLAVAHPENVSDASLQFPGTQLPGDPDPTWRISNSAWCGPERMRIAHERLDAKLKELGIAAV